MLELKARPNDAGERKAERVIAGELAVAARDAKEAIERTAREEFVDDNMTIRFQMPTLVLALFKLDGAARDSKMAESTTRRNKGNKGQ